MDDGKYVSFDATQMRHFGSSRTDKRPARHVSISCASQDAQVFTNAASTLAKDLSHALSKTAAITLDTGWTCEETLSI
jgi:hypothetical protein